MCTESCVTFGSQLNCYSFDPVSYSMRTMATVKRELKEMQKNIDQVKEEFDAKNNPELDMKTEMDQVKKEIVKEEEEEEEEKEEDEEL